MHRQLLGFVQVVDRPELAASDDSAVFDVDGDVGVLIAEVVVLLVAVEFLVGDAAEDHRTAG